MLSKFQNAFKVKPKVEQVADAISLESSTKIDDPSIYLMTANICAQKNQFDAAASHFRKALEIDPGNIAATKGMGQALQAQGKFDEAIKVYRQGLNDHPQDLQLVSSIGSCLMLMNEPEKAIQVFQAVIEQDPANPLYREQLALVLVKQNDEQAAFDQLAAVLPPGQAAMSMGKIHARLGNQAKAIESLESAFRQDETLVEAIDLAQSLKGRSVTAKTEAAPFNRIMPPPQIGNYQADIAMMSGVSEQPAANPIRVQPVAIPYTEARILEEREAEFRSKMDLLNQKLAEAEANQQASDQISLSTNQQAEAIPRFKVEPRKSPFQKTGISSTLKSILR